MALIRCSRCMQPISNTVEICPECEKKLTPEEIAENNAKNKKTKKMKIGFLFIGAFFAVTFIVASLMTRESTTTGIGKSQLKVQQTLLLTVLSLNPQSPPKLNHHRRRRCPRLDPLKSQKPKHIKNRLQGTKRGSAHGLLSSSGTSLRRRIWRGICNLIFSSHGTIHFIQMGDLSRNYAKIQAKECSRLLPMGLTKYLVIRTIPY